ncbi:MAG TPA: hypothetical protein VM121_06680 [Acidimicrobiales bacterium]|nr:hypothetical protein [Acidimicrobiales bacterium]
MKSVSRLTTVVIVTLALACGVALADGPETSPVSVESANSSGNQTTSTVGPERSSSTGAPGTVSVAELQSVPPDGSSVLAAAGAQEAGTRPDACAQIVAQTDSINATFDKVEQLMVSVLPDAQLAGVIAVLEASRDRVIADLDAAFAACVAATSTTTTSSTTSTTAVPSAGCAALAAQKNAVNAQFDAAEAELRATITGEELAAAIASIEVGRTQTNAAFDSAIAACAAAPSSSSTSSTTPTNSSTTIPAASCAEIQAERAVFNAQLDAAEAQLRGILAAGSEALTTAISGIEAERASGNAEFDAALANC